MTAKNTAKNLEELLQTKKNLVDFLRNQQTGPNVYPGVPAEYTNWRDEQQAWQHTCVLFNQSYHMADLAVEGPDALKLLSRLSMNSFKNFEPNKAKQFAPCSPDGYIIGDVILFYLAENKFNLVGRAPALNWVTYHAQTGKYDVKVELDQRSALRTDGRRKSYRFQVQGPNAMKVIAKVIGKTPPELKFFNMTTLTIAGKTVRALRHGMAGQPGWELFGPWDEGEAVREAIVKAGEEFGLRLVGARAYSSNALESGWIPSPLPAVYTGASMKAYREWLPATGYEAAASIGGSFYSQNIEDYYFTPWDMAYDGFMKFDHDFIGREALEKMSNKPPPQEGHAGARQRRRHARARQRLPEAQPGEVHRLAVGGLHDASVRPRDRGRQDGRHLHLDRLQLQRRQDADAGRARCRARRARHRSHLRVGRAGRRLGQADGRAPHADLYAGDGQPGALRGSGAQGLCAGRLARGVKPHRHPRPGATCLRIASMTWAL